MLPPADDITGAKEVKRNAEQQRRLLPIASNGAIGIPSGLGIALLRAVKKPGQAGRRLPARNPC